MVGFRLDATVEICHGRILVLLFVGGSSVTTMVGLGWIVDWTMGKILSVAPLNGSDGGTVDRMLLDLRMEMSSPMEIVDTNVVTATQDGF
ncbi:hypothetical protein ACLOJK_004679 [Asimina triloba]